MSLTQPLTKRQKVCLDFIAGFMDANGYSPTFQEIADSMNVTSLATVHKFVGLLEKKGFIRRSHNCSRSIDVIALPRSSRDRVRARIQDTLDNLRLTLRERVAAWYEKPKLAYGDSAAYNQCAREIEEILELQSTVGGGR